MGNAPFPAAAARLGGLAPCFLNGLRESFLRVNFYHLNICFFPPLGLIETRVVSVIGVIRICLQLLFQK